MANTVRADFDQIALGECVQLVNPECAPAVTQFRNHTGPCRKRVHRRASFAVVKGLQCLPDRIIQVVPGPWFSFPGFLLEFKTIVLSEARRTSQLPTTDFWANRQLKGLRQALRSKQHLLQLVPPEFPLTSDITGCDEDSCRHLKVFENRLSIEEIVCIPIIKSDCHCLVRKPSFLMCADKCLK